MPSPTMIIGVPKEVKLDEYRVAMLPVGVEELTRRGHRCSSKPAPAWARACSISEYQAAGAELIDKPGGNLRPGRHDREGEGAAGRPSGR